MTKTKEESNQLKEEHETINNKLKELSGNELKEITGGAISVDSKKNIIILYDENTGKVYGYFPNTEDGVRKAYEVARNLGLSTSVKL